MIKNVVICILTLIVVTVMFIITSNTYRLEVENTELHRQVDSLQVELFRIGIHHDGKEILMDIK